jgi:hypothetical protein
LTTANFKPGSEIVIKSASADSNDELSQSYSSTVPLLEKGTTLDSGKLYLAQQDGYAR